MVSGIAVALYMASAAEDCRLGVSFQGWLLLAVDQSCLYTWSGYYPLHVYPLSVHDFVSTLLSY